jgi:hypothetical protein
MVCHHVFHRSDRDVRREAERRTRQDSAPGVDQVTAKQYAEHLDEQLRDRHARRRDKREVAPPVERVWSAKAGGQKRPRSKACCEDKMVPRAVGRSFEAIVEPALQAFAQGLRRGPRAQQA